MPYCPHCKEKISHLDYTAYYSEVVSGNSSGTIDIESGNTSCDDTDSSSYDNFEENDYTYTCPECEEEIDAPEDCLIEPEEEDESNKATQLIIKKIKSTQ